VGEVERNSKSLAFKIVRQALFFYGELEPQMEVFHGKLNQETMYQTLVSQNWEEK
jgi:hypothetical protein